MPWTRDRTIETEDQPVQLAAEAGDYVLHAWQLADGSGAWLVVAQSADPDTEREGRAPSLEEAQRDAVRHLRRHLVATLHEAGRLERVLDLAGREGSRARRRGRPAAAGRAPAAPA